MTAPAAAREGKYGVRYYPIPDDSGEIQHLDSVSAFTKVLAAPGLEIWKQRTLAAQFAKRPDLVMLAGADATRDSAIKQALDGDQSAANIGTATHGYSEMVDDGTLDWDLVPEGAKPWVANYAQAKEDYGWELVDKEFTVYNHRLGYAGTSDRALRFPGVGVVIADLKTGRSVYAEQALQLAFYAYGEGIWIPPTDADVDADAQIVGLRSELNAQVEGGVKPDGKKMTKVWQKAQEALIDEEWWRAFGRLGQRNPMPADLRTDVGFILHLRPEGCQVVPMNLTGSLQVIEGMSAIFHWKKRKDIVGEVVPSPGTADAAPDGPEPVAAAMVAPEPPEPFLTIHEEAQLAAQQPAISPVTASDIGAPPAIAPAAPTPPVEQVWQSLRQRLMALSPQAKEEIAFRWPSGVPGLKVLAHTPAQLEEIDRVLFDVECKHASPVVESSGQTAEKETVDAVLSAFPGAVVQ